MSLQTRIEDKLRAALAPTVLEVDNESGKHAVPAGSETHFRIIVVAPAFDGRSLVDRHRMVYEALGDELRAGVHALAITSRSPGEWERAPLPLKSPPCMSSKTDRGSSA